MSNGFFIKVKAPHARYFVFLTSYGFANRHRKRAAKFSSEEEAQALIDAAIPDNPGWKWKIVPINETLSRWNKHHEHG